MGGHPQTSVAVSVTLDGFTVTGTAQLVGYEFDFGEALRRRRRPAGSEAQPAVRHTYETKGDYTLRVASLWHGEFVMTGPGITTPLPVDLRTAQLTTTRDYRRRRDPFSPHPLSNSILESRGRARCTATNDRRRCRRSRGCARGNRRCRGSPTAWDGLKSVFAKPIVFVVDTILNNGLIAGFNKIADFVGSKNMSDIPLSDDIRNAANGGSGEKHARGGIFRRAQSGYQTGGVLPGYTPGQDVHHFSSPSGGSLHLSGGEAIMRPEFTAALGSGWVDKMNTVARAEGVNGIKRTMGQRYAKGGIFFPLPGGYTSTYAGHDGVDINAINDEGKPFYSATSGVVSYTGEGRGYGNAVFVNSPYGELVYGHSQIGSIGVSPGKSVSPGSFLARVGSTGNSSGPHLHFGFPGGTYGAAMALLSGANPGIKAHAATRRSRAGSSPSRRTPWATSRD